MNFAAVLFSAALLLHNAVTFGDFFPAEEIDNPSKKATGSSGPDVVARTIYNEILAAGPTLRGKQFGFLYLHDGNREISYLNEGVKKAMKNKKLDDKIDANPRPAFWPTNVQKTNILMAMPDKKTDRSEKEMGNRGHSEHKLLGQLENLRVNFVARHRFQSHQCPEYVILGTYLSPCFSEARSRMFGCAQDYVEAKNEFTQRGRCPTTAFHLYVPVPEKDSYWRDIEKLMHGENINIITGE